MKTLKSFPSLISLPFFTQFPPPPLISQVTWCLPSRCWSRVYNKTKHTRMPTSSWPRSSCIRTTSSQPIRVSKSASATTLRFPTPSLFIYTRLLSILFISVLYTRSKSDITSFYSQLTIILFKFILNIECFLLFYSCLIYKINNHISLLIVLL